MMDDLAKPAVWRFDDFLLDKRAGTLLRLHRDGRRTTISIGSRAFQILCLLTARQGEVVSHHEIMDAIWPNVAVEPSNLTVQISALRRVLDACRTEGSCIQNVPGRGYRFIPDVEMDSAPSEATAVTPAAAGFNASPARSSGWPSRTVFLSALCLLVAAALASVGWYAIRRPAEVPVGTASPAPTERPRLSVVVLPFANFSGDALDETAVDRITDDLTTHLTRDLMRIPGAAVIGRDPVVAYKNKPLDVGRIGSELGVRYAVNGSVRKSGDGLAVNTQLVSTETGAQLWADRFEVDGGFDDLQIAFTALARIFEVESTRSERERPNNPDITDLLVRATAVFNLPPNPENRAQLVALYERALELDATSVFALAGLAEALIDSTPISSDDPVVPTRFRRVEKLLTRAEQISPHDRQVMFARTYLLGREGRCQDVIPAAQRAIELHPELTGTHMWLGICLLQEGRAGDAIAEFERSIRKHMRNPQIFGRYFLIGYALLFLERYDESIVWFRKSLAANPGAGAKFRGDAQAAIAAAQALAGHTEEAHASAAEAMRALPTFTAQQFYAFNITNPLALAQIARVQNGLRLAGIRDHVEEDVDFGLASDSSLPTNYEGPTPNSAPSARTIRTSDLALLVDQRKPLIIDGSLPWGKSIPAAIALWGAGVGGSIYDEYQERLGKKVQQLTRGDRGMPIVAMGWNAERYQGRNLALRLVALGYSEVYWYRGGREAWSAAGLPQSEIALQEW
jgi:TolB-like protein/DNA-binding winged helix-turn-helix (wHTH) protein